MENIFELKDGTKITVSSFEIDNQHQSIKATIEKIKMEDVSRVFTDENLSLIKNYSPINELIGEYRNYTLGPELTVNTLRNSISITLQQKTVQKQIEDLRKEIDQKPKTDEAKAAIALVKMFVNSVEISDTDALSVASLFDEFDSSKDYKRGTKVLDGGVLYKSLHDVTSEQMKGNTPKTSPTLWTKVLGESDLIEEWEQPSSDNGYKKGSKVKHNGKIWVSLQDNNVWEPGSVGAPWKESE